jgi:hypothetical protein
MIKIIKGTIKIQKPTIINASSIKDNTITAKTIKACLKKL